MPRPLRARHRREKDAVDSSEGRLVILLTLGVTLLAVFGLVCWLSQSFRYASDGPSRPIRTVVGLFMIASVLYCYAAHVAAQTPTSVRLMLLIFVPAILFRVVMLWSEPIQEVDVYRYLWDGAVTRAGVSPFRYPPKIVLEQGDGQGVEPTEFRNDLRALYRIRQDRPALQSILERVHYGQLPSVYPPTSQAVFAAVDAMTPDSASMRTRVNLMRITLILFELTTGWLVVRLLRLAEKPIGLAVLFTWCPLLVKETANSGHLDAIAVFLTTLAIYFVARMLVDQPSSSVWRRAGWGSAAMLALGLATGAKLYPIVLGLWCLLACIKCLGSKSLLPAVVFPAVTWLALFPILPTAWTGRADAPPWLTPPEKGIETFLRHWEMNDFLFLITIENLKDPEVLGEGKTAWFSWTPSILRDRATSWVSHRFDVEPRFAPFHIARAITGLIFVFLATVFAIRAYRDSSLSVSLEMAFLTIAWFILLSPTQNPWYWSWALPLLAFARSRVWWLFSGLLFTYYLRFWFNYHFGNVVVGSSGYTGTYFFDLVVTWIEFAPWFLLLAWDGWRHRRIAQPA